MAIEVNSNHTGPLGERSNVQQKDSRHTRPAADANVGKGTESVRISDDAQALRRMAERIERQDAFDESKVNEIRRAISEGQYPVNSRQLAKKFLELENQIRQ